MRQRRDEAAEAAEARERARVWQKWLGWIAIVLISVALALLQGDLPWYLRPALGIAWLLIVAWLIRTYARA